MSFFRYKPLESSLASVYGFMSDEQGNEKFIAGKNQMPNGYNTDYLRKDLQCLNEGILKGQVDTVKTNLNNALSFIADYFDFFDSPDILNTILEIFLQSDFVKASIQILENDTDFDDISYLFEIYNRLFDIIPEKHPLQDCITTDLLISIMNITISPSKYLHYNHRDEGLTLNSLFGTINNIPVEKYNTFRANGISAIRVLCKTRNDLMNFTMEKILPHLYNSFIEKDDESPEATFEVVNLYSTVVCYLNIDFTVDDLIPFMNVFMKRLILEKKPQTESICGLMQCVSRNPGIVDEFTKSPLFENLNTILNYITEYNSETTLEIQKHTIVFISEMFEKGSYPAKMELSKFLKWERFNMIGQKSKNDLIQHIFCKSTHKMLHYTPALANILYSKGILKTITNICTSSSFETRNAAFECFIECVTILDSTQISDLISNKEMIETLIEFVSEDDDSKTALILNTLSTLLRVGENTTIIKILIANGIFSQIEEIADLLQNVENPELFNAADSLYNDIQICKQEMDEFEEVGDLV